MYKVSFIALLLCTVWSLQAAKCPHGANFKLECASCHSPESWKVDEGKVTFDHSKTRFPLVGQHKMVSCRKCHTDLEFSRAKTDCNACHTDVHQQTTGRDCERCHTPNSWLVTNVKPIHRAAGFPLVGAHASADCRSCHKSASTLRFEVMSKDCYSCHRDQYNTAPGHLSKGYSKNCVECHSASAKSWAATNVDHSFFPLTDGHAGVKCEECHGTPHKKVSPDCYGCHKKNYDATKNPNHISAKFATNCVACHTIKSWKPANFNHNTATAFPLKGGHVGVDCIKCHTTGYKGTPTTCVSCHLKNYNATTNPAHATAKFSTDCKLCHTVTAWKPSTFNHDAQYFRIYSGKHRGEWTTCTQCHITPSNFASFSCINCHEHSNKASVDADHKGKVGYTYSATSCYGCHARI